MATKATKASLETRVAQLEGSLAKRVAELEAITQAIGCRLVRGRYVALPMRDDETRAVEEILKDMCSERFGEGHCLRGSIDTPEAESESSEWEDAITNDDITWRHDLPMPQWDGYLVRYWYNREEGTHSHSFWGLISAK